MLWALLRELAAGRSTQTPEALARALGIAPIMVPGLMQELARYGYLSQAPQCASGCDGCALQSACSSRRSSSRLWIVTPKGFQALAQQAGNASGDQAQG